MRKMFIIQLTIFLLISSCNSTPEIENNNPEVQIQELGTNILYYDEIIRINNCGGPADSEQTISRSFATTIEGGVGISAGFKSIVEGNLSAKYNQYQSTTKSQKLIAPPGTNMEFVLRWSDEVRLGTVTINNLSNEYTVRIPIAVEQISSRDLAGCDGVPPTTPTTPLPTQTQDITPTIPASHNLVQNPGFEEGMYNGGWEWGIPIVEIQSGHSGASALCSRQDLQQNQTAGWVGFHQDVPVSGNQKYNFSAWARWQNASQVHMKISWFDNNTEIDNYYIMSGVDGDSDWVQRVNIIVSPANATKARLTFWHGVKTGNTNVPGSMMCIDDVFFALDQ